MDYWRALSLDQAHTRDIGQGMDSRILRTREAGEGPLGVQDICRDPAGSICRCAKSLTVTSPKEGTRRALRH